MPFTETLPMRPKELLFNNPAETTNSPIILALLERAISWDGMDEATGQPGEKE